MENNQSYYISKGKKCIIDENQNISDLSSKSITKIKLNNGIIYLICAVNQIKELVLPDQLKKLCCTYNQIKELKLNKNLEILICHDNQINELYLNEKLERLLCDMNVKLYNIPKNCEIHYYRTVIR